MERPFEMTCCARPEQPVLGIASSVDPSIEEWGARVVQEVRAAMHEELAAIQVAIVQGFQQVQVLSEGGVTEESRSHARRRSHVLRGQTEMPAELVILENPAEDAAPAKGSMLPRPVSQLNSTSSTDATTTATIRFSAETEKESMIEPKDRTAVTTIARSAVPANTMEIKEPDAFKGFKKWLKHQFTPPPSFRRKKRQQTGMIKFVESATFQWTCAAVMLANFVYLGWYANWTVANEGKRLDGKQAEEGLWVVQTIFEIWFLLECGLRLFAYRTKFVFGEDGIANFCDLLVVVTPSVQLILELNQNNVKDNGSMGVRVPGLSILRCVRVLRVAYTFELFRLPLFAEFRMIVNSLIKAMPAFIWVSILAAFCVYVQGVCCLLGVASKLQELSRHKQSDVDTSLKLRGTWSSIECSLLQIFMSITGGVDWIVTWEAIEPLNAYFRALFLLWMIFMCFACLNTISGMFIERAVRTVNSDRDFWIIEEARQHRMYADRLMGLFHRLDLDHNSSLTWQEFDQHLANPHIAAYFSWLGVDISNAQELFILIDADSDGKITVREFLEGCIDLKGAATNVAVRSLRNLVDRMQQDMMHSGHTSSLFSSSGVTSRDRLKRPQTNETVASSPTTGSQATKQYRRGYFTEEYLQEVDKSCQLPTS